MRQPDLETFLDTLPPKTRQLVLALREVVLRTVPEAEEQTRRACCKEFGCRSGSSLWGPLRTPSARKSPR
jgi:hypothetical protein